ncbi:hypothetical protein [Novosphingobium pentaromativorans]|uniref:hypothetical protein n=1 Tax=Novosphingobium pentaromativorans TaxID=205844 RepID=UPI000A83A5C8|nr:hypothetical protein [Novosphingobium pentaromativorans]
MAKGRPLGKADVLYWECVMTGFLDDLKVTRSMQLERLREPVSRQARIDNMIEHMQAEHDNEFERLAATISPDPCWNLHPIGAWQGWESVLRMYHANFPFAPEGPLEMIKGVHDPRVAMWGEDHVLFHMAIYADEYPLHRNLTILIKFQGNLVQGETVFLTDENLIAFMRNHVKELGTDKFEGFVPFPAA